ncbi:MAG: ribosome small subunit-dependent GTPase A [Caldilineaceae bacterium]|nr:ribosome small subunit-dependent GTPase A [Caldilineaceae bacterium]
MRLPNQDQDEYLDDELDYEEIAERAGRNLPRSRKAKPKRASANLLRGIVVRARGHHYDVAILGQEGGNPLGAGGEVRMVEVRGRLLQDRGRDTLVAVGDYVWIVPVGKDRGQIERIEERESVLSRQHPGVSVPAEDVILANPDQVLVVFAIAEPDPHLRMLDRFLVIAEANELPAIICINKLDLASAEKAEALFSLYSTIGYTVIYASTVTGEGIDALRTQLSDRVTVISGPSGVGKSSLLNAIQPGLNIQIGDISEVIHKGRHTTRAAQLYALPFGTDTFVADTPGIRELGLYEIDEQSLGFYFREFVPFIHDCHYPNCTHNHEPECAVRKAVEMGVISLERYDSYLRLLHGEE